MKQTKSPSGYFDELAKITELRREQLAGLPYSGIKRAQNSSVPSRGTRPTASLKIRKLPGRRTWSH